MKPVCLIIGAGAGIGGNVGRKFAQEGFHAVLCRRSDEAGLNNMVEDINSNGGSASGFLLNAIEDNTEQWRTFENDIGDTGGQAVLDVFVTAHINGHGTHARRR